VAILALREPTGTHLITLVEIGLKNETLPEYRKGRLPSYKLTQMQRGNLSRITSQGIFEVR